MSPTRQILVSVCVFAAAAAGWYFYTRDDAPATGRPAPAGEARAPGAPGGPGGGPGGPGGGPRGGAVTVVTVPVAVDTTGEIVSAIGSVTAVRSVDLYPQVTGIVAEVAIEAGKQVDAGAPLLRLENEEEEIALDRAKIALEDAKSALERSERLGESNAVSQVSVSAARTAVKNAEIDLRSAELALARRTVTAPFAGVVGLTSLSLGDLVNTSTLVTTIDDLTSMIVPFEIPERYAARVEIGQKVKALAEGLPGAAISGIVSSIDSRVTIETRSLTVKATLAGAGELKPGMAVTLTLDLPVENRLSVPSAAIQWDRNGSFIWTVADQKASRTAISILGRRSGVVLVAGELAAGDAVVIEGVQRLRPGITVSTGGGGAGQPGQAPGQSGLLHDRPAREG